MAIYCIAGKFGEHYKIIWQIGQKTHQFVSLQFGVYAIAGGWQVNIGGFNIGVLPQIHQIIKSP